MFYSSSPNALYQDYEARVDAAVLKHRRKTEAQPVTGRGRASWQKVQTWLSALRARVELRSHLAE